MTEDRAETLALTVMAWLLADDDLRGVFLGATGASADDLRAAAGQRETLVGVLDFLTLDDAWVLAFCDAHGLSYEDPLAARAVLAGPAEMHWT